MLGLLQTLYYLQMIAVQINLTRFAMNTQKTI